MFIFFAVSFMTVTVHSIIDYNCGVVDCNKEYILPFSADNLITFNCPNSGSCNNLRIYYGASGGDLNIHCEVAGSCINLEVYVGTFDPPGALYGAGDMNGNGMDVKIRCQDTAACDNVYLSCKTSGTNYCYLMSDAASNRIESSTVECNMVSGGNCWFVCDAAACSGTNNLLCHTGSSCSCSGGCSSVTKINGVTYSPTTDTPTTAEPTTATISPTFNPITNAPTTNIPTTFEPTTNIPTTYIPTTSKPNTIIPFTSSSFTDFPTTDIATTYSPTFSDEELLDITDTTNGGTQKSGQRPSNETDSKFITIIVVIMICIFILCVILLIVALIKMKKKTFIAPNKQHTELAHVATKSTDRGEQNNHNHDHDEFERVQSLSTEMVIKESEDKDVLDETNKLYENVEAMKGQPLYDVTEGKPLYDINTNMEGDEFVVDDDEQYHVTRKHPNENQEVDIVELINEFVVEDEDENKITKQNPNDNGLLDENEFQVNGDDHYVTKQ